MMKDKLNYFSAIKFLYKYIRKSLKHFVRFYLGWFFLTVLEITMPILFGIMIDEIVYRQDVDVFVGISFVFVTLSLFSCLLFFMIYAQHHYLFNMYTLGIKRDLFSHLLNSDAQYMSSAASGDIAVMIQKYPEECMHFVVRNIIHPINGLIKGIAVGVYLMLINWQIGLFALLVAPVAVYINVRFGKKIRGFGNKQRDYYGGYISWLFEMLTGLKDIRLLGAKRKADKTFQKSHDDMFEVNIKTGVSIITAENIIAFTNLVVQMVIFALAGYWAASGDITVGLLTVIVAFYSLFTNTVQQISQGYLDSQTRVSYIQKIYDFLRSPSENVWSGKNELKVTNGEIHFNDISFAYDGGKRVLDGFDLNIQPGERFALVGKSGSGKTTLAYMLIGFYAPQIGSIEIDGQNLAGCSLKSIRGNVGLIQQDVLIFDGSIKDNILLGRRNATDAELRAACNQAGIWDFVKSLPQRLDTLIGNSGNGVGLSGGQKQRIAIARIYLKNPKIIIFDEATSSLDDETEGMIHEEWNRVLAGRTSIVIAHRQSSVMNCARAAVLVGGRVGEVGSPHELAASSGKFQSLFALRGEDNAW